MNGGCLNIMTSTGSRYLSMAVLPPITNSGPDGSTPGHWLEWSRLLLSIEAAYETPPAWLFTDAQALFRTAVAMGWAIDGHDGFVYTLDWDNKPADRSRPHSVIAEQSARPQPWENGHRTQSMNTGIESGGTTFRPTSSTKRWGVGITNLIQQTSRERQRGEENPTCIMRFKQQ